MTNTDLPLTLFLNKMIITMESNRTYIPLKGKDYDDLVSTIPDRIKISEADITEHTWVHGVEPPEISDERTKWSWFTNFNGTERGLAKYLQNIVRNDYTFADNAAEQLLKREDYIDYLYMDSNKPVGMVRDWTVTNANYEDRECYDIQFHFGVEYKGKGASIFLKSAYPV